MGTSTVFLDFGDGCYTTLSVGKYKGRVVLWVDLEGDLMVMSST